MYHSDWQMYWRDWWRLWPVYYKYEEHDWGDQGYPMFYINVFCFGPLQVRWFS